MNPNIAPNWSGIEKTIFRVSFCYLIFYFLFLSNFFTLRFPFVGYIHKPFQYISDGFVSLVNRILIHNKYGDDIYTGLGDTSWFVIACLSYLTVAIITTAVWTFFDKRKTYLELFTYLQTYARYYLAFVLLLYGLDKLFGNQFGEPSGNLIRRLGDINSHTLLWTFMGASESYNFFAGLVETTAGALLLFRRTTILGSLISFGSLINILVIDIAYDTLVKMLVVHLILISIFILSPDLKRLFDVLISKPNISLTSFRLTAVLKKFRLQIALKFMLIAYVIFTLVKVEINITNRYRGPFLGGIDGIYEIKEFSLNREILPPLTTDTLRWKNFTIGRVGYASVQFMNDSSVQYTVTGDSISKSLSFTYWNDSTFRSKLHYTASKPGELVLEGTYKNDSVRFTSNKINLKDLRLLKDKGKIKWVWW